MKPLSWAARFEEQKTCEDILGRVHKTQITFWIYMVILVAITLGGLHVLMHATETRAMLTGLFMALVGIINIALIKIWAHIRLVMFYIIWDSQNRLEAELNKSLAEDL